MTEPAPVVYRLDGKRVWVAGHCGMVGSALVRRLRRESCEVLTVSRAELDLRDQTAVAVWMRARQPDVIILAAATVGGILANDIRPSEFLYDNLMIEANIIHAAHACAIDKLLFLGSSCIYRKLAPQPMSEEALLTGPLEPTNEWYAIAKIAGIKQCLAYRRQYDCDFICAMSTNLYGPGDNYDLNSSHVLPALLRKADEATRDHRDHFVVWGSGAPRRDFLFVDDLADALIFLLQRYSGEGHINIGTGQDVAIRELAEMICEIVGFGGALRFDRSNPDGTPRKLLDVSRLTAMGWQATTPLRRGIEMIYAQFRATGAGVR
jgi:GDP-L-fucose synthase